MPGGGGCLTTVVKWLRVNKQKLNPDKTEVMLVGKAKFLRNIVLPGTDGIQMLFADSFKSLADNPALLIEKQVSTAAKSHSTTFF